MARYFFHLHECGIVSEDREGILRDSLQAVHDEAVRSAREVMCAEVEQGRLCLGCCIRVTDEAGEQVMEVPFREAIAISGL